MISRRAIRQLNSLEAGETLDCELCIPCAHAIELNDIARIGGPSWLNDGLPDCEGLQTPLLYCALCRNILRARTWAESNNKPVRVNPGQIDWDMWDMYTGIIIADDDVADHLSEPKTQPKQPEADKFVRAVRSCPDTKLLRSWINTCKNDHGLACNSAASVRSGRNLRFIDTKENCVVPGSFNNDYFALSYVWGSASQFKLLRSNQGDLATPGSLSRAPLPKTIKDAMAFTLSLNERYIWVDALCIVQDDNDDKSIQISQMASVYQYAVATIVAMSGMSASSGLDGISPSAPRNVNSIPLAPGLRLGPRALSSEQIESSIYHTRAWTYQERLLSPRCLFVGYNQVIFKCASAAFSEDRYGHNVDDNAAFVNPIFRARKWVMDSRNSNKMSGNEGFQWYSDLVSEYTEKKMGFPSDVINAFTAILSAMEEMFAWEFWQGLPTQHIDTALLWTPVNRITRREIESTFPFPTASWAGWVGPVHYDDIVIYPPQIRREDAYRSCVSSFYSAWKGKPRFLASGWNYCGNKDAEEIGELPQKLPETALIFNAYTMNAGSFALKETGMTLLNTARSTVVTQETHFLELSDSRRCGITYGLAPQVSPTENVLSGIELILLSTLFRASSLQTCGPTICPQNEDSQIRDEKLFDDCFKDEEWNTLNVLLVESRGGCHYRVGIAQICREAWEACRSEKKTIILA
jgi:hypothetical protein